MGCGSSSSRTVRKTSGSAESVREPTSNHLYHDENDATSSANVESKSPPPRFIPQPSKTLRETRNRGKPEELKERTTTQEEDEDDSSVCMLDVVTAAGTMRPLETSEPPLPKSAHSAAADTETDVAADVDSGEEGILVPTRPMPSLPSSVTSGNASIATRRISTTPSLQVDFAAEVNDDASPSTLHGRPHLALRIVPQPSLGGSSATSDTNGGTTHEPAAPLPMCGLELLPLIGSAHIVDHRRRSHEGGGRGHDSLTAEGSGTSEGFGGLVRSGDTTSNSVVWCMMGEGDGCKTPANSAYGDVPLFDGEDGSGTGNSELLQQAAVVSSS